VALGLGFTIMAILGFNALARFSGICSPWMFLVFVAGALATLPKLGVRTDLSNLWHVFATKVWNGVVTPGQEQYGFWHIVFFAWFANLAMHIGLSDMALLRYAKSWKIGLTTAVGVYPGHFLAWLCSGIMVAAVGREMTPGRMADEALGVFGVIAVVLAGWTTANPTLYRAGLALQSVTPDWPRWKNTLYCGLFTPVPSVRPGFCPKLPRYLALYGLILTPVGAIVFTEHWILPRIGVRQYQTELRKQMMNWPALLVWFGTLAVAWVLPMHLFYRWLPCWFLSVASYALIRKSTSKEVAA